MLKYNIIFAVMIWTISATEKIPHIEQKFIREIKEGPYQNYSGQPLVDLGGKFYYFEVNVASTWSEASSFCRSLGQFLVSIEDSTEHELIKDYILTSFGTSFTFWTSGSDTTEEGQFVWMSTGRQFIFTDWHDGEPNDSVYYGGEDFVVIWYKSGVWKWNDFPSTASDVFALCEEEI